jgi:hypothetical protein
MDGLGHGLFDGRPRGGEIDRLLNGHGTAPCR